MLDSTDLPAPEAYRSSDDPIRKNKPKRLRGIDVRVQLVFTRAKRQSGPCKTRGCKGVTSGGKPVCIKCLDTLPYVQKLKSELAEQS